MAPHVRSQAQALLALGPRPCPAPAAEEEPISSEKNPQRENATTPFDRRRDGLLTFWPSLLHPRRCQCPPNPARAATPATVRYGSSPIQPSIHQTLGPPPLVGTPDRRTTHPLELDRCGPPVFRPSHPCPLHTLNVLLREPHIKSHVLLIRFWLVLLSVYQVSIQVKTDVNLSASCFQSCTITPKPWTSVPSQYHYSCFLRCLHKCGQTFAFSSWALHPLLNLSRIVSLLAPS